MIIESLYYWFSKHCSTTWIYLKIYSVPLYFIFTIWFFCASKASSGTLYLRWLPPFSPNGLIEKYELEICETDKLSNCSRHILSGVQLEYVLHNQPVQNITFRVSKSIQFIWILIVLNIVELILHYYVNTYVPRAMGHWRIKCWNIR